MTALRRCRHCLGEIYRVLEVLGPFYHHVTPYECQLVGLNQEDTYEALE